MINFLNSNLVLLTAMLLRSPLLFAEVIEATMVSVLAALLIPSTRRPGATYEKPRNNSCAVALGGTPGESKKLKQNRHQYYHYCILHIYTILKLIAQFSCSMFDKKRGKKYLKYVLCYGFVLFQELSFFYIEQILAFIISFIASATKSRQNYIGIVLYNVEKFD